MAGMFYSLIEVAEKLGKSENQVKEMVTQGKLREFRDGAKLLFKKDEVDAIAGDTAAVAEDTIGFEDDMLVEGSTLGLLSDEEDDKAASNSREMDIQSGIDMELDASGLDLAMGGSDLEIDLAASRAGDLNTKEQKPVPATPKESVPEEEELTLSPVDMDFSEPVKEENIMPTEDELMSAAPLDSDLGGSDTDFLGLDDTSDAQSTKVSGEGLPILGESDKGYEITNDAVGETAEIKLEGGDLNSEPSLDEDVNLESFGSGSGLLDLSLQADDTSLGAVLDDIIPTAGAGDEPVAVGDIDLSTDSDSAFPNTSADAEPMLPASAGGFGGAVAPTAVSAGFGVAAMGYIEPMADASSNAFGISLIIPFIAVVYAGIAAIAASQGVVPGIVKLMQGMMAWYVVGGMLVLALLIVGIGAMSGGAKTPKTARIKPSKPVAKAKPVKAKGKK